MKNNLWKRLLPLFLSLVMLFSVFATAFSTVSAVEVAAPSVGNADDDTYYRIVFEDGMLRVQLNPQKVYDLLRDGSLSREDLLNFIPEDVLDTLEQGRDLSLDDLKSLASNYFSPSDLEKLKDVLPVDILQEHFDLAMLEDLITVEELLSVVPIDELLEDIDDDKIADLITPAALKLLLNEKAKNAVLTDEFVESLLNDGNILDEILADEALKQKLATLIDGAVVDQLLANDTVKANLLALMESPDVLDKILNDSTALTTLKNFFATKQSAVSAFLTDSTVIDQIKGIQSVHDSLIKTEVINNLISAGVLNKDNVRTIFSDEQLDELVHDPSVLENLLGNASFVDNILGDTELVDTLITDSLLTKLLDAGVFNGKIEPADVFPQTPDWNAFANDFGITVEDAAAKLSLDLAELWAQYGADATVEEVIEGEGITAAEICSAYGITVSDLIDKGYVAKSDLYKPAVMREILLGNATARDIVSDEIHAHPEISLGTYWDHLDFTALVGAIGIAKIQAFVNTHDDVYENLLHKLAGSDIAAALGDELCTEILQNNASAIIRAVGMPKLFEYFSRDEIVAALGGYYAIIQKGYVDEEDVIAAIGGYPALLDYLALDDVIEAVGYDRLLDFVSFNDIVASAGGYDTVFSWYTPTELQEILKAIGTEKIEAFLRNSGILQQLDFRQITSDLLALLRSKGPQYKAFLQEVVDRFLLFLNTEVASIHINDTRIYYAGRFNFEAIVVSILQAIPDVDDFLAMNTGDVLAQWILRANIRGEEYKLGVCIEFFGDFSELQDLMTERADDFRFDVSDDFDVTSEIAVPAVGAEIYAKILLSSRVSDELKEELLNAPANQTLGEFSTFLTELTDDELASIVDAVSEKIDEIRAKAYAKLDEKLGTKADKLAAAKAKVDQILDKFTNVDKVKALRDKVLGFVDSKIPAELADKTLADLYEGNQSFRFEGAISEEFYGKALTLLQKLGLPEDAAVNILVYFGNTLALDGSFDVTTTFKGIYQLSIKDSNGQTHTFYLPEGIDLSIISETFPSLAAYIPDGAVMPPADTTLSDPDVWWQVDFYADGVLVKSAYYLKGGDLDPAEIPDVPEKLGYSGVWGSYSLNVQPVVRVDAIYTKVVFTTTISHESFEEDYILEYSQSDRTLELPIPEQAGYIFDTWYIDVDGNGEINDGDIRLTHVTAYALLRATTMGTFALPEGEILPAGNNLNFIPKFDVSEYEITFVDYNGNPISGVTLSYNTVNSDKAALAAQFPSLSLTHYTLEWYVGDTRWADYDLSLGGDITVTCKKSPIHYTATFTASGTSYATIYTIENTTLSVPPIPAPPAGYETDGEWYVISVDGVAFVNPVKLSEYTVAGGNLDIIAIYKPINYTATFYDGNGNVWYEVIFTVESGSLSYVPNVPTKEHYTGVWEDYTLGTEDLHIRPVYTPVNYTATFTVNGATHHTLTYTVENTTLDLSLLPPLDGMMNVEWYVVSVNGTAITPVKLSDYTVTHGNIVLEARYALIEYNVSFIVYGSVIASTVYTIENPVIVAPSIPDSVPELDGYTRDWYVVKVGGVALATPVKLSDYTVTTGDLEIEVKYTPIHYQATFYDHNGVLVAYAAFTMSGFTAELPDIPSVPQGYEGTWYVISVGGVALTTPVRLSEYVFTTENIEIKAFLALKTFTATFWADGVKIGSTTFTIEDTELSNIPSIPEKNGYTAAWQPFELGASDLEIHVIYTAISYQVTFKADGQPDQVTSYSVDNPSFTIPTVPAKLGYENGIWYVVKVGGVTLETPVKLSEFTVTTGNLVIEARYTPISYTATFWADGVQIGSTTFTVEDTVLSGMPPIPQKAGYTARWEDYTIGANPLEVHVIYTLITYNVNFVVKGESIGSDTYTVEDPTFTVPTVPAPPAGYLDDGAWYVVKVGGVALTTPIKLSEYTVSVGDLEIEAKYTPYVYTATFYDENGNKLGEADFTVEGFLEELPPVPVKPGYLGSWNYVLQPGNMDVSPVYTLIEYEVNFIGKDGSLVSSTIYTVQNPNFTILPTPDLTALGYKDGVWYVVKVDGVALATPIKLSEYTVTLGNLEIEARYTPIVYTGTVYDGNNNKIGEVTFTVEGLIDPLPPVPAKPGYTGAWSYVLQPGNIDIRPVYTIIHYNVTFVGSDGSLIFATTYTVENATIAPQPLPNAPLGYTNGAWYVVKVDGVALATPIKLSEYTVGTGDLEIEARYELKIYKAYFRVDGTVVQTIDFTIETEELSGIRDIPAKRGYSAKWSDYTLGLEDLYIDAIYTVIQYTATFEDEDGKLMGSVNFTINDTSIKAPDVPEKAGYRGAWYVVAVGGTKITPVLLAEYSLTDADLTVQLVYEAVSASTPQTSTPDAPSSDEEKGSLAWLWWIIIILIIIIIILIVLLILKKKNLPPFRRAGVTPPAIIAAAIPEVEEEETPVSPSLEAEIEAIVTVESIDVETADEMMSDAVAMAVVETIEEAVSSVGPKVILNLHVINDNFVTGDTVDLDALKAKNLVSPKAERIKILADGTLDKHLTVIADSFSVQAIKMITLTGGHAIQKKSKK